MGEKDRDHISERWVSSTEPASPVARARRSMTILWTLLIRSIINFALMAPSPAAVRERPVVRLDVNVTRNVTAASESQKHWDPLRKGST